MSDSYRYVRINDTNAERFAGYLPGNVTDERGAGGYSIGILCNDEPVGAVVLEHNGSTLTVQSLRYSDSSGGQIIRPEIFASLQSFGINHGFKMLSYRYADDESGINENVLRDLGFTDFTEEASVFRIDGYSLGSLIRDGAYAASMREAAVRLMHEHRVTSLQNASEENSGLIRELHPDPGLSFMTVDDSGHMESFTVISEMPDGSLYLADLMCADGHEEDLMGLLYMSLGKSFMQIGTGGELYIAAVNDRFRRLAEFFTAPVRPLIRSQRIMNASRILKG